MLLQIGLLRKQCLHRCDQVNMRSHTTTEWALKPTRLCLLKILLLFTYIFYESFGAFTGGVYVHVYACSHACGHTCCLDMHAFLHMYAEALS